MIEQKKKFKIKKKYLLAGLFLVVGVLFLIGAISFVKNLTSKNNTNNLSKLESEMETIVSSFYDENIKGKVFGVHKQIVTLENLQNQGYDISKFTSAECSLESYSYVILKDSEETDVNKIKYTVENHLDCKK